MKKIFTFMLLALWMPLAMQAETLTFDFEDGSIPSEWVNDNTYPWTVVSDAPDGFGGTYCIKCGNSGVASSSSTLQATYTFVGDGSIRFLAGFWGEGSETVYDSCSFFIDGVRKFGEGAADAWYNANIDVPAGEHTFTWVYKKDGSVNATEDAFFLDNIELNLGTAPEQDPIVEEDGWVHYDNGEFYTSIGYGGTKLFYWSIKIPAGTVSDWFLTKVSAFVVDGYHGDVTVLIYQGGSEPMAGDLLHSQVISLTAEHAFQEFALMPSVLIDPSQDLWIVFGNTGNVSYPASCSTADNAPNARWVGSVDSEGNVIWEDVKEYGYETIAWMVRGHFASAPEYHPYALNIEASDITAHSANISWEGYETFDLRYKKHLPQVNTNFPDEDFEDWTTIDADGDGHEWEFAITVDGLLRVGSASYKNGGIGALTPDNYLVSPRFKIGDYISFKAYGVDNDDFAEHFGVAVSTTSNTDPDAFTTIWETTMDEAKTWKQYTVDLRAYKGQEGYVAIRHFDCTNQYWLLVNDIMVYPNPDTEPDWTVVENLKTDAYELSGLEPESEYWVQIKAYHGEEETEWSPVYKFVTAVSEEGIESVSSSDFRGQKVLRDGQLMIIRGEKMYNVLGTEVK